MGAICHGSPGIQLWHQALPRCMPPGLVLYTVAMLYAMGVFGIYGGITLSQAYAKGSFGIMTGTPDAMAIAMI